MKNILLFVLILSVVTLYGQDKKPFTLKYNHVALSVKDVNASAAYYHDVLGLKELKNPTGNPLIRWFDTGNGTQLHLITGEPHTKNRTSHFSLSLDDIDVFVKYLNDKHIKFTDWEGHEGQIATRGGDGVRQVYITDPDGYWIEINNAK